MSAPAPRLRMHVTLAAALLVAAALHWGVYTILLRYPPLLRFYGPSAELLNRLGLAAALLLVSCYWFVTGLQQRRLEAAMPIPDPCLGIRRLVLAQWTLFASVAVAAQLPDPAAAPFQLAAVAAAALLAGLLAVRTWSKATWAT